MGTRQSHFISLRSGRLPLVLRMKLLLVWCLVLFSLAALALAQQEDVVSNCAKQCSKACKCPCAAANTKPFVKYTKMKGKGKNKKPVADAQCLFDPSMGKKCGRCIKGGKQCGPPMHQWCQNPKSKMGCKGIPNFKYTLSTRGAPCFNNPADRSCPICKTSKMKQCGISKIASKCGKFCAPMKDRKCDGNRFDCTQIDLCGPGASCAVNSKAKSGICKCDEGLRGDGINCFHDNGTVVEMEEKVITMSMNTKTQFFVYTQDEL